MWVLLSQNDISILVIVMQSNNVKAKKRMRNTRVYRSSFPSNKGRTTMSKTNHETLGITGMSCAACSSRVEKVLNKMDGVEAQVNLTTEKATVDYDSEKASIEDITEKIENVGYGVLTEKAEFDVFGMTCAACSTRIEK